MRSVANVSLAPSLAPAPVRSATQLSVPFNAEIGVRSYTRDLAQVMRIPSLSFVRPALKVTEKIRRRELQKLTSWAGREVTVIEKSDTTLLITNDLNALNNRRQTVLIPKGEQKFDRLKRQRLLVPVGQDDAGLRALSGCLGIAVAQAMTIVIYHTTWRKNVASTDAWDHMTEKSRHATIQAVEMVLSAGLSYELVLEIEAPGVSDGIIRAANAYRVNLIAMAYSQRNLKGSKAENVAASTNIPILVIGDNPEPQKFPAPKSMDKPATNLPLPTAPAPALSPWLSIHRVMSIAIVLTLIKGIAKILLGLKLIHSNAIAADGYHSLSDVLPDMLVMALAIIAKRSADRRYPLGRGNLNTLITLGTGICLTIVCGGVIWNIALAIYHALIHQPISNLKIGPHELPIAMIVTLVSAAISFGVGSYQIYAGKKMREPSVAVDGAEMRGDGLIELATAGGLFGAYLFNAPWIEHLIGAFVLYFVGGTAKEFLTDGIRGLTQKSLGEEIEDALLAELQTIPGLMKIVQLKTFAIGGTTAVAMLKIEVVPGVKGSVVQDAIRSAVTAYFAAEGTFGRHEIWIEETEHAPTYRVAVAVTGTTVAARLCDADELWIYEVGASGIIEHANRASLKERPTLADRIALLTEKKTNHLVTLFENDSERTATSAESITLHISHTLSPDTLFFE